MQQKVIVELSLLRWKHLMSAVHWCGMVWYGVVYGIIWYHMGWDQSPTFSFKGKTSFSATIGISCALSLTSYLTQPCGVGGPKAISCAGQKRKEQAGAFPFSEILEYVKNFSASIEDHWPCFVVCYWVSLAVICCLLTRGQTAKLPNCHCHSDWAPRESFNPTPWIAFYPIERTHTHLRCECAR